MPDLQRAHSPLSNPFDLTGRRSIAAREEAVVHAAAVDRAIAELRDPDTQLEWVTTPGRSGSYPIPREVLQLIKRAAR